MKEKPTIKDETKAIPLPKTVEPKKKPETKRSTKDTRPIPQSNIIPTAPEPGSGGMMRRSGGNGGGFGGGSGISIGPSAGGFRDSQYARAVESRISENWTHPPEGMRVEMIYSFYIGADGTVSGIKLEKSSGNPNVDMDAERAIRLLNSAWNPLSPPPPEFRSRPIKFVAQFIYPPN